MIAVLTPLSLDLKWVNGLAVLKVESGRMIAYLPVYELLEDAMREHPDSEYMEIKRQRK